MGINLDSKPLKINAMKFNTFFSRAVLTVLFYHAAKISDKAPNTPSTLQLFFNRKRCHNGNQRGLSAAAMAQAE
jgi:hypothetical protein